MTVLEIMSVVIKPEKQEEFMQVWKRFLKYREENPDKTKSKSVKLFTQTLGGTYGRYILMEEYDTIADWEKEQALHRKDETYLTEILQKLMPTIIPQTLTVNMYSAVE